MPLVQIVAPRGVCLSAQESDMSSQRDLQSALPNDIAYRMLRLEQQLESYRRLHEEELKQMYLALQELKEQVLALVQKEKEQNQAEGG